MLNQDYNWKRFWCLRSSSIRLSDDGYLPDPDSVLGRIYNPNVVPYETIASVPCLVLLGEPGIGKTHAMRAEREAINTKIREVDNQTLWLDLRSYGSEDRLIRDLFGNMTFVSWVNGKHILYMFLDSLDECLLRINNLATLLIDEFRKLHVSARARLYLRIACRSADWPYSLEDEFKQLWGNDSVKIYELTPLRRINVEEATKANKIDHIAFLREIDRIGIVPLATKPITLRFLLTKYNRTGVFPLTQAELYFEGCRLLCEETSDDRRSAHFTGAYTARQRMAVAARIAAITVFTNRYAIWTGLDLGDVPDEDIIVQKLYGGIESINGDQFNVNEDAIRETLATALFSSRGQNRIGWRHQTYAEFLAAQYLVWHKVALSQILSLIVHPNDPDGKLVPQLHETAARLAGMMPDLFLRIMQIDPEVLLRSDIATTDVKARASLVEVLLRLCNEGQLLILDKDIYARYSKLNYLGLAEQLLPYICNDTEGISVKQLAIDIAEACKLITLQDCLVEIALDPHKPHPLRIHAARAIVHIGDDMTKAKLKPLAIGKMENDVDDELKGCSLQAIWPTHLTVEKLFTTLSPPKKENLIGMYHIFLSHDLIQHLALNGLPKALKWVEELGPRPMLPYAFKSLMDNIMLKAWDHLELPGVLESFAKAALSRFRHYDEIVEDRIDRPFISIWHNSDERRHQVLKATLPMILETDLDCLVYSKTPFVMSKDVPWMIGCKLQNEKILRVYGHN